MDEDNKGLALTRRRVVGCDIGEVVKLQAISEHEEAVMKVEDSLRKIPVLVPRFCSLAACQFWQAELS